MNLWTFAKQARESRCLLPAIPKVKVRSISGISGPPFSKGRHYMDTLHFPGLGRMKPGIVATYKTVRADYTYSSGK